MIWVPTLTSEAWNNGIVDDVAQMMISADSRARLTASLWSNSKSCIVTSGNLELIFSYSDTARLLRVRLTIVHLAMDGKCRKWRSRCASICWPAPKDTIDSGRETESKVVERSEPRKKIDINSTSVI